MAKKNLIATERGTFLYPHLTTPDTKFDDDGIYKVKLNLPASEKTAEIIEAIDAAAAEALAEAKKENASKKTPKGSKPPKLELCDDMPYIVDDEDGSVTFSFKMKASGKDKDGKLWTRHPALFDSKGNPLAKKVIKIGSGTEGKISFELSSFYQPKLGAGVTLRLYGAQILKLVEWGERDAAGLGFGVEDDGFSADDLEDADNEFAGASAKGDSDDFTTDGADTGEAADSVADDHTSDEF